MTANKLSRFVCVHAVTKTNALERIFCRPRVHHTRPIHVKVFCDTVPIPTIPHFRESSVLNSEHKRAGALPRKKVNSNLNAKTLTTLSLADSTEESYYLTKTRRQTILIILLQSTTCQEHFTQCCYNSKLYRNVVSFFFLFSLTTTTQNDEHSLNLYRGRLHDPRGTAFCYWR